MKLTEHFGKIPEIYHQKLAMGESVPRSFFEATIVRLEQYRGLKNMSYWKYVNKFIIVCDVY